MDLPQVKAAVKAWEKAFRAKHEREPTKEDIKSDRSGIAEQYALYRKLSKAMSGTAPISRTHGSSSQPNAVAGPSRTTPKHVPNAEYPTTPTPVRRRSAQPPKPEEGSSAKSRSNPRNSQVLLEDKHSEGYGLASGSKLASFLTPHKPRQASPVAYSSPVHDPNPHNPFLASPSRSSPFKQQQSHTKSVPSKSPFVSAATAPSNPPNSSSPFIHAMTPKKLKQVLEANSLRSVKARMMASPAKEVTPRTRARKRLRGELVDDTPGKEKVRKKRGEIRLSSETQGMGGQKGKSKWEDEIGVQLQAVNGLSGDNEVDHDMEEVEGEDDDEFGPSPMKDRAGPVRSFTSLLGEVMVEDDPKSGTVRNGNGSSKVDKGRNGANIGVEAQVARTSALLWNSGHVPTKLELKVTAGNGNGRQAGISSTRNGLHESGRAKPGEVNTMDLTAATERNGDAIEESPFLVESSPRNLAAASGGTSNGHKLSPGLKKPWPPSDDSDRLPTPPLDAEVDLDLTTSMSSTTAPRSVPRRRLVKLQYDPTNIHLDAEYSGADPTNRTRASENQAGIESEVKEGLELVIVSTRRAVRRARRNSDVDQLDTAAASAGIGEGDDTMTSVTELTDFVPVSNTKLIDGEDNAHHSLSVSSVSGHLDPSEGNRNTNQDDRNPKIDTGEQLRSEREISPRLLSLLSLKSPTKPTTSKRSARRTDLLVKSLFDPAAALELKAIKKGQEVMFSGEAGEADVGGEKADEEILEEYGRRTLHGAEDELDGRGDEDVAGEAGDGGRADYDWESESEGWKRTGEDMDDW